jgi:crossover junction endodeoxyribonuclease RuvC
MALMIAIGVDPGTLHLGWGVVRREGSRVSHVAHGVIDLDPKLGLPARLGRIADELDVILDRYRPQVAAVETLFFHRDAQAAAKLGHARGVVLLCLTRRGVELAEYAPARVKRTVAGNGRAAKSQVAQMVRAILALREIPPSDAGDALALALTHLRLGPLQEALERSQTGAASRQPVGPRAQKTALQTLLRKKRRVRGRSKRSR